MSSLLSRESNQANNNYCTCVFHSKIIIKSRVEAASKYYFQKSSKDLSKNEAAWIATILPNPKKYDPKNPSAYLNKKHRWILRQMNNVSLK